MSVLNPESTSPESSAISGTIKSQTLPVTGVEWSAELARLLGVEKEQGGEGTAEITGLLDEMGWVSSVLYPYFCSNFAMTAWGIDKKKQILLTIAPVALIYNRSELYERYIMWFRYIFSAIQVKSHHLNGRAIPHCWMSTVTSSAWG